VPVDAVKVGPEQVGFVVELHRDDRASGPEVISQVRAQRF
jgi:hypothetical protein